jgi:hypothetical protein
MHVPYDAGRCTVNAIFQSHGVMDVFPYFLHAKGVCAESLARFRGWWQARLPCGCVGLYSTPSEMSAADWVCDVDGASA